jgi:hypothetical protein
MPCEAAPQSRFEYRPMTNSRLKKNAADEIARDGFGCFTGWAHRFET